MNHNMTFLAILRLMVFLAPILSMFSTLQKIIHSVSTAFGISEGTYGGTLRLIAFLLPLMGMGQGNGAGPAGYAALSSVMVQVLLNEKLGAIFTSPITGLVTSFACFIFVDDCDLPNTTDDICTPGEDLLPLAQSSLNHWQGAGRASGGALAPDKSFWYLIDFIWDTNRWRYRSTSDMPGNLYIHDDNQNRLQVTRHKPHHAEKILGIQLAADGNMHQELDFLKAKIAAYTKNIIAYKGKEKNDVWISLKTGILKTLEYPMIATTMDQAQWESLMQPLLSVALPHSGISSKFPRTLIYAPACFQGLGLYHPWYHQELKHLCTLMEEMTRSSTLQKELLTSWELIQLEVGTDAHISTLPKHRDSSITHSWLKTLIQSMRQFGISFHLHLPTLQLTRENDVFLMQAFETLAYPPSTLELLNQCRCYLKVISLADITSACGKYILQACYDGQPDYKTGIHKYNWPRQPTALSPTHWTTWQTALQDSFLEPFSTRKRLRQPLQSWLVPLPGIKSVRKTDRHRIHILLLMLLGAEVSEQATKRVSPLGAFMASARLRRTLV